MKLHRFIGKFNLGKKEIALTEQGIVHQILGVLRLKKGDEIVLCNGAQTDARAEILATSRNEVRVRIIARTPSSAVAHREVTLYCAILKRENFEMVAQKATEVGVSVIVPLITQRTVKLALRIDRLQIIAREAAEQCGRGSVPHIAEPLSLTVALQSLAEVPGYYGESGDVTLDPHILAPYNRVAVFIGPEGGWTPEERVECERAGLRPLSLGSFTLRAETAAIVATHYLATF